MRFHFHPSSSLPSFLTPYWKQRCHARRPLLPSVRGFLGRACVCAFMRAFEVGVPRERSKEAGLDPRLGISLEEKAMLRGKANTDGKSKT